MPETVDRNLLAVLSDDYWMRQHLVPTLQKTFRSVELFFYKGMGRWNEPDWVAARPIQMRRLWETARTLRAAGRLDLMFMMVYDDFLFPEVAARIRSLGVRLINYHVDMPVQWYRCIRIAPQMDLIGVSDLAHFDDLTRYGGRLLFVPMAANVEHFRPLPLKKEYDVLFMGTYSPARADAVAAAADVAGSVRVAGNGWGEPSGNGPKPRTPPTHWKKTLHDLPYLFPRLQAEGFGFLATRDPGRRIYPKGGHAGGATALGYQPDIVESINKAQIVLGVNQQWGSLGSRNSPIRSRLRDFEVPACGTLYMVQRYPELARHYVEDEEVVAWSTLDELRSKVEYYLAHEEKRRRISAAGRERVLRTHRWEHRYRSMVDYLDQDRKG